MILFYSVKVRRLKVRGLGNPRYSRSGDRRYISGRYISGWFERMRSRSWIKGWARKMFSMNWIMWALLSACFAATTALLAKVGVAHVDSNLAMALRTTVVVVFAWGLVLALGKPGIGGWGEIRSLDRRTCLFLTLSGLATGLSWICYFRALQLGPASRVAPLDKLSGPLVMIFAWLLLGEKLTTQALAGGLLITAGAVVIALA
jgi:transporter family protein